MATNWTLSQALAKITEGTDKAAIQDIGRRFPLTAVALAEIGKNAGAAKIIGAIPSHITARKIESVLKDGVEQDADVEDTEDEEEAPKKETKKPSKKAVKEKTEEDAEDEEEDDPVALYKKCKKAGLKVAPKKSAKYYKDQLVKAEAAEEDADDDDWDDEEEDEKPAPKKKPAKKSAKKAEPEDDEDDDEWDI